MPSMPQLDGLILESNPLIIAHYVASNFLLLLTFDLLYFMTAVNRIILSLDLNGTAV